MDPFDQEFEARMLCSQFKQKTQQGFYDTDAVPYAVEASVFDETDTDNLFTSLSIFGWCLWDANKTPRILFRLNKDEDDHVAKVVCRCCFSDHPQPREARIRYSDDTDLKQVAMRGYDSANQAKFTLYFQELPASYCYCCQLEVSPFTIPSVCHDKSFGEIMETVKDGFVPQSLICIVIHAKVARRGLYYNVIDWLLQCEHMVRLDVFFRSFGSSECVWPQKKMFHRFLKHVQMFPFDPEANECEIHEGPFPSFKWIGDETVPRPELAVVRDCVNMFIDHVDVNGFLTLISGLILEFPIYVLGKEKTLVSDTIMALTFMVYPLQWIMPVISLLPEEMHELVDSPVPSLIGTCGNVTPKLPNALIVDLDAPPNKAVRSVSPVPHIPDDGTLMQELTWYMEHMRKDRFTAICCIVSAIEDKIRNLLEPVPRSIVSDFTSKQQTRFMIELFLANFEKQDRHFMRLMRETQMFEYHLNRECRRQSALFNTDHSADRV